MTNRKYTTAAMIRKLTTALSTPPRSTKVPLLLGKMKKPRPRAASVPPMALMRGLIRPLVKAVTIAVNAVPMTTATARSTTLPRIRKSLKPFSTVSPPSRCPLWMSLSAA
jgi:hypothetical protein